MAAFPTTVATDSDLYIAVNALSTQLTDNPLSAGATTVNVTSAALFPTVGFISIDNEIIKYTGKTGTSFTGCTRAADGTSASSHVQNSQVFHNVIAVHHNALKDDLIATEQFISDLIGRTNTQILSPNGTAALPSRSFNGDPDTGDYRVGANSYGIAAGGAVVMTFAQAQVEFYTTGSKIAEFNASRLRPESDNVLQLGSTSQGWKNLYMGDGTLAAPAIAFSAANAFGFYRAGTNRLGLAFAGTLGLDINFATGYMDFTTNMLIAATAGTVAAPFIAHRSNLDTGFYFPSTTSMAFTVDGSQLVLFDHSNGTDFGIRLQGGNLQVPNGTAAAPTLAFLNFTNTGFFNNGTNSIRASVNGTQMFSIDTSTVNLEVASLHFFGTAANPGIAWGGDSDTGFIRDAANSQGFVCGGTKVAVINSTPQFLMQNGTAGNPSFSFINGSNSGMYYDGTANTVRFAAGGTQIFVYNTTDLVITNTAILNTNRIVPNADNTYAIGTAGARYTTIFATTGTINTSHSSTKENIVDLDVENLEVPRGVEYDRDGRRHMGYLNDCLPDVARPFDEQGNLLRRDNYENAVLGILCAKVRYLESKLKELSKN